MLDWQQQIARCIPTSISGSVVSWEGTVAGVADFPAPVGAQVEIQRFGASGVPGEVVGFRNEHTLIYPWGPIEGVRYGTRVRLVRASRTVPVGADLLGRVVDARGRPIDGGPPLVVRQHAALERRAPEAVTRPCIERPLSTGIRAIDGLLTCGLGQRLGIFAGAGVGKSVTLGMLVRNTSADVAVVALIGERGREVNEFLQRDLGASGLARSVVVVATSDEPAPLRVRAALTATAIAESFRDQGQNVLLVMDSLTRFAHAQREIGLAAGEPPTTRGYPPSTFALLPKLVERAGTAPQGSITGFYSVLVEGDDPQEPISDAVRGLLDGHIHLSRRLAGQGHFPAIDVLESISRVMPNVVTREQRLAAARFRSWLAAHRDHADLISIGAYRSGSNPLVDQALAKLPQLNQFLRQDLEESTTREDAQSSLARLVEELPAT